MSKSPPPRGDRPWCDDNVTPARRAEEGRAGGVMITSHPAAPVANTVSRGSTPPSLGGSNITSLCNTPTPSLVTSLRSWMDTACVPESCLAWGESSAVDEDTRLGRSDDPR
eukprot:110511-Prorocentrum_minimum.AAC.1